MTATVLGRIMPTQAEGFESGTQQTDSGDWNSLLSQVGRCYLRNFTFYLADPSARLTSIARAVQVNRPYLVRCVLSV
jgi:hypothetical protein